MHFHRIYLSQQVADRIEAELRSGAWRHYLPSERQLAVYFNVGRRTIRAALDILARKKTFRYAKRRRIIVSAPKKPPVNSSHKTAVLIVSDIANRLSESGNLRPFLDHYFALSGYGLQVEIMPARENSQRWLEKTCNQSASVWLLRSVTRGVQLWFEKRNLPALILGSRHEGIRLPDLDIDHRALCRHAVNTLLRLGHRRIVYFSFDSGYAGDLASELGFNEAFAAFRSGAATGQVVRYTEGAAQVGLLLERLFKGKEPPTAIIFSWACYVVTALWYLSRIGKRVPEDVSFICRDKGPILDFLLPPPAHYNVDMNRFARRAVQLAIGIDQGVAQASARIIPQFVPGASLAPRPPLRA